MLLYRPELPLVGGKNDIKSRGLVDAMRVGSGAKISQNQICLFSPEDQAELG